MSLHKMLQKKVPINVFFSSNRRHISVSLQQQQKEKKKKKQTDQTEED